MVAFAVARGKGKGLGPFALGNRGARRASWRVLVEKWLAAILR
jgi:hypothetical protein